MMKLLIDILLLVIIVLCTWQGYRRGIIGGVAGLLAIVLALYGGRALSSNYAHEVVPALEPFVDGYVSSKATDDALEEMGYGSSTLSLDDILARDSSLRYDFAYACIHSLGIYDNQARVMADRAVAYASGNSVGMAEAVVYVLCDAASFVGGMTIGFLMILILLVALANICNLSFRLPNMEVLDEICGAGLGFFQGFVYCVLLCWILGFFGLIIGQSTLADSTLGRFFLAFDYITKNLL